MGSALLSSLFFLVLCSIPLAADSAEYQDSITAATLDALAKDPVWLRLLHWDLANPDGGSFVRSSDFLLTEGDESTPRTELAATIRGFLTDSSSPAADSDRLLQCRYPARFLWLTQKGLLDLPPAECPRLRAWAKFERLDSVSLMLISGYFGNPASTFGHILLKVNNGSIPLEHSLFDLGINYGALVPEGEPTLRYVLRGLFGSYEAGFSDQDFYRFDQTYSRTEFRDMWEYELQLDNYQIQLLMFHLWEISGRKFQYFFIKGNCAFRLAELLELVSGENFVQDVDVWYAPVSVFHRLQQVDADRSTDSKLIKSITYVPSARRVFQSYVDQLSHEQKDRLADYVAHGKFPQDDSAESTGILNTIVRYYEYKLAALPETEGAELREHKDAAIVRRLQLPGARTSYRPAIANKRSPAKGSAPSRVSVGAGRNEFDDDYAFLSYAPFGYDSIGNNGLQGSTLSVVDIAASVFNNGRLELDYFDLFRARKVNLNRLAFLGESTMSWELAGGARQDSNAFDRDVEAFATGHAGRAFQVSDHLRLLLMGGATVASHGHSLDARAAITFGSDSMRVGAELRSEYRYLPQRHRGETVHTMAVRLSLSQDVELRLRLAYDDGTDGRLFLAYHF